MRNHGKDENVMLASPRTLTIETALEWIDADELIEVTPDAIRVRKQILSCSLRPRRSEAIEDAQAIDDLPAPQRSLLPPAFHRAGRGLRRVHSGTSDLTGAWFVRRALRPAF